MSLPFRFCPHDGTALLPRQQGDNLPRPSCPTCGFVDYGNPKPCVAVVVEQEGRLLLGRRAIEPGLGLWDILGGFIDAQETAEEAVHREIAEETGLEVRIVRYLGSFPDVYGPQRIPTLSFGFVAEPIGGAIRPESDVAELRWFPADALPDQWAFRHQERLIAAWRNDKKEQRRE